MEQSVPKHWHIKFRRRGITKKKAHNIQNTAKVWNQENYFLLQTVLRGGKAAGVLSWPLTKTQYQG